ncbi:glutathione S-transferase N-terminal domain-containing protein [Gilvimarinus sp. SDUM040013]|uniref:Glutathione S-transferase N-terminal domain-containing protein n=1 Tax=Gilvimarinus gilvus TaxID=3058038 RepID=A0ABU4RTD4_9GAMM|nr:glutathione S-transferase N-terminal domain-containing protein [Gilvimarinus sp. SDUM040013]MDO3386969.1 glutathione S-transferase N-terminal domain-containing protein [Gilvimarinus sp. SDUM040013]MDX6848137.1 glutathione S-transferase N-terminal domain-containing protein [Gilvimarinus sp. SDUM040013]
MHLHQVMQRWPAQHPSLIQLYSKNTPNGIKVALALEEMHLSYEAHAIDLQAGDQHSDAFHIINPNGRIPALIDPDGPDGHIISLMESGAILRYLADKTGEFIPFDRAGKSACDQWLFFQSAHIAPCCHLYSRCQHLDPASDMLTDLLAEIKRGLSVLDQHLSRHTYMLGESYSIADMAIAPWVAHLATGQEYAPCKTQDFSALERWRRTVSQRPAFSRASRVCP